MMPHVGVIAGQRRQFSPTDITGLELWLDTDSLNQADASAVTSWPDTSGNDRDFVGSAVNYYDSTYTTPSGRPVVWGTNGNLQANPFMSSSAGEIFLVVKIVTNASYNNMLRWTAQTGGNANDHWHWSGTYYEHWGAVVRKTLGGAAATAGWHIINIHSAASDWGLRVDALANETYSTTSNTVAWHASNNNHVIGDYSGTGGAHQYAEACVFDHKLSAGDRALMFDYLHERHFAGSSGFEENAQTHNSGGTFAGQSCTIKNLYYTVRVTAVKWDGPHTSDTYTITIDGVVQGSFAYTDGEYPEYTGLDIILEPDDTFTFEAVGTTSREYGYVAGEPKYTENFQYQEWVEAGGGESVPLGITFEYVT